MCMIAASARLVQISIERSATLMSGLGGITEKPIRYGLVRCVSISGGGELERGHPPVASRVAASKPPPIVMLGSLLSADEDKHRADRDRRYSGHGRNQPLLLGCDLDWSDLDFIAALRVAHTAHREDDRAGDDEKHTNPSEWPHCYPVGEKDISCGPLALHARRPRISTRIR